MHRLDVRSASTLTEGRRALLVMTVEPTFGSAVDAERLSADIRRALEGTLDLAGALRRREEAYQRPGSPFDLPANSAAVVPGASRAATVVEVRAHDRPGLLYRLTRALTGAGVNIASAHLESRGANVVDTFYLTDPEGQQLTAGAAQEVLQVLQEVLDPR